MLDGQDLGVMGRLPKALLAMVQSLGCIYIKVFGGFSARKKLIGSSSNVALTAGALNSSGSERDTKKC